MIAVKFTHKGCKEPKFGDKPIEAGAQLILLRNHEHFAEYQKLPQQYEKTKLEITCALTDLPPKKEGDKRSDKQRLVAKALEGEADQLTVLDLTGIA